MYFPEKMYTKNLSCTLFQVYYQLSFRMCASHRNHVSHVSHDNYNSDTYLAFKKRKL